MCVRVHVGTKVEWQHPAASASDKEGTYSIVIFTNAASR